VDFHAVIFADGGGKGTSTRSGSFRDVADDPE
jgi:hypothetical protein